MYTVLNHIMQAVRANPLATHQKLTHTIMTKTWLITGKTTLMVSFVRAEVTLTQQSLASREHAARPEQCSAASIWTWSLGHWHTSTANQQHCNHNH